MEVNLSVELAPKNPRKLTLRNPVMTASGTFGYGVEYANLTDIQLLGAVICKGTTLHPREGNPSPRLVETPSGMLNAIGLQNIGVQALIREMAPLWATWEVPVIVNIAGESIDDYVELADTLEGVPGVAGIEVNVSCPNTARGGKIFGCVPELVYEVTAAVKKVTSLPIMVKLTPNVTDIVEMAKAAAGAGADSISLINTLIGMAIDVGNRRPVLGNLTGGLSGPAIKPVALRMVYQVAEAVDIPIVGMGGISSATDALEFILAGATAVQVGMATFRNPNTCVEIIEGLDLYLQQQGILDIKELRGVAHR